MKETMKIYDNGGKSFDRYSVVFLDQPGAPRIMKTLKTLVAALLIFACLSVCFVLGNELLRSIDTTIQNVRKYKSFNMEVEQ